MAKDRDWVDYANVAANVVQTAQLASISGKLRQMAELELQKEYREQQEAAVAKCEDLLRDAVFVYTEQLRDVDEIASQNPVEGYIRAHHLKRLYADIPQFKASGFRRFEDKERLANVQRSCDRLIREGAARLKPDDLDKCKRCVDHIFERDELAQLIPVAERRDQLAAYRASLPARQAANAAEFEKIKAQQQQNKKPLWLTICEGMIVLLLAAIGVIFLGGVLLLFTVNPQTVDRFSSHYLGGLVAVLVGMIVCVPILLGIKKDCSYVRRRNELANKDSGLSSELAAMTRDLSDREAEIKAYQSSFAKFGTARTEDYKTMLSERDMLLTTMLGDLAKEIVQRTPRPIATVFDVVLVAYPVLKKTAIKQALNDILRHPDLQQEAVIAKAKRIDKGVPNCLFTGISETLAKTVRDALISAGAEVEVHPTT